MKPFDELPPHELLGVAPKAGPEEIRRALDRLSRLLAPGSMALYSVLGHEEQRELAESMRIAGALLLARHSGHERASDLGGAAPPAAPESAPPAAVPAREPRPTAEMAPEAIDADSPVGARLAALRRARSLTLAEVAERTRIPIAHLANIEAEAFASLPMRAYLRGFVITYARLLKLDPERAWEAYRRRLEAAGKTS